VLEVGNGQQFQLGLLLEVDQHGDFGLTLGVFDVAVEQVGQFEVL
jgi:hypothetical protein